MEKSGTDYHIVVRTWGRQSKLLGSAHNLITKLGDDLVVVVVRDVNEARSGRGRGQSRGRGQLSRGQSQLLRGRGRGQNCINFFSQCLHFYPIFSKKISVDFRRDFKNFGSKRALTWELY